MPDPRQPEEKPPINRRNTMIALGAIAAIVIVSNFDGPDFNFGGSDHDSHPAAIVIDGDDERTERINAALEKIPESIEARIEEKIENSGESRGGDAEFDAAVDELAEGDPDQFVKWVEDEVAGQ